MSKQTTDAEHRGQLVARIDELHRSLSGATKTRSRLLRRMRTAAGELADLCRDEAERIDGVTKG